MEGFEVFAVSTDHGVTVTGEGQNRLSAEASGFGKNVGDAQVMESRDQADWPTAFLEIPGQPVDPAAQIEGGGLVLDVENVGAVLVEKLGDRRPAAPAPVR